MPLRGSRETQGVGLVVAGGCCRLGVTWSEKVVGTHEKALAGEIHQGKNTHPTRGKGGGQLSLPLGATGTRTTAWDSPGAGTPAPGLRHPPPLFGVPGDQALRPRGPRPRHFGGPSPALGCLARPPPWEGLILSPAAPQPRAGRLHPQATARSPCAIWALRDATSTGPPEGSAAGKGCRGPTRGGPICSPKASPGPSTRHGGFWSQPS